MHWAEEPPFLPISQIDLNPYTAICVTRSTCAETHKSNSNWFPWIIHRVTKCQGHESSLAFLLVEASSHSFCTGKNIKELPHWSAICKIITSSAKLNSVFEADATVARLVPPRSLVMVAHLILHQCPHTRDWISWSLKKYAKKCYWHQPKHQVSIGYPCGQIVKSWSYIGQNLLWSHTRARI